MPSESVATATRRPRKVKPAADASPAVTADWGRRRAATSLAGLMAFAMVAGCPSLAGITVYACDKFDCSIGPAFFSIFTPTGAMAAINYALSTGFYRLTALPLAIVFGWILLQAVLHVLLPGKVEVGERTPDGNIPKYKVNGLLCWAVTHALYAAGVYVYGRSFATAFSEYHMPIFIACNIYGFAAALAVFLRAHIGGPMPGKDRVFTSSLFYDFLMGVDLHPRIGKGLFDLKLFHNSHAGMIVWTLVNLSYMMDQYYRLGYVSPGMVVTNVLQAIYCLDFFVFEAWYLKTIDIALDHFGWYLAWGITNWLPFTYTMQARYLAFVSTPPALSLNLPFAAGVLALGCLGYFIFRSSNHSRNEFRRTRGQCTVWGKPAKFIRAEYVTGDGKKHESLLLTSGFWGLSRHFNYIGDWLLSFAYGACCGFDHLMPHLYFLYMVILLVHRTHRDDSKCRAKYGKYWEQYCETVRYKLIPGIY